MKKLKSTGKELTRAEEQIMHILWEKGAALVHNILEEFPDPKPAYNTVSTIIRILEQKGFVGHKAYGRTYEYFPLIDKKEYTKTYFRVLCHDVFDQGQGFLEFFLIKGLGW